MEEQVVRDETLVRTPNRLEAVEVVLGRLTFNVAGLIRQMCAGRVDAFAARPEYFGDRVLGQPVNLEVGPQTAQFVGDGDVALGVTKPDGRRDVERALAAAPCSPPRPGGGRGGCWLRPAQPAAHLPAPHTRGAA